jgi:small conductance mechanosensitive channel
VATATQAQGLDALSVPLQILAILAIAIVGRWLIVRVIRRTLASVEKSSITRRYARTRASMASGPDDTEAALQRYRARSRAVGSLLTSLVTFTIFFAATVAILNRLGVNVAPILASAGVVGIAIGFGAQNLIRDLISGVFIIVEDQFGVGDVVDMPSRASGTVEMVGLRSTQLRDDDGVVWYIPNGLILSVGNRTQGNAVAKVDIAVGYGTDLALARASLNRAVESLESDPAWAAVLLAEEPKLTVADLSADAVTLRIAVKTTAGAQDQVADELRERALTALLSAGVAATGNGEGSGPATSGHPTADDD